jgi:TonB-dependent SusC/RagA subfamily outer membrane receptor
MLIMFQLRPVVSTAEEIHWLTINQNNIESITVLKDASATAIYGSRASNVIIIPKKGKAGDLQVSYMEPSSWNHKEGRCLKSY